MVTKGKKGCHHPVTNILHLKPSNSPAVTSAGTASAITETKEWYVEAMSVSLIICHLVALTTLSKSAGDF